MVEFTRLKLMLMKREPDVFRRCKEGMVLVDSFDDTLGGVSKNSLLKPEFPTALQQRFKLTGVENPDVLWSFAIQRDRVHRKLKMCQTGYCGRLKCEPAKDNAEDEWYGFAAACEWFVWYRGFWSELQMNFDGPTPMGHDNKAMKDLLCDSSRLGRTQDLRVAQNYPRFLFQAGMIICIWWCGTVMCAAMLTKSLRFPKNE